MAHQDGAASAASDGGEAANSANQRIRCALYRSIEHGWHSVFQTYDQADRAISDYVRVSEVVEVEFPPLTSDAAVAAAIHGLDAERQNVVRRFTAALAKIDRTKAELLAITHQVQG